jgi:benzoyl-CoA reductase/2-hydroxyglutaryl-CoA dehydratase subunit BcrC/BadD/HgdB
VDVEHAAFVAAGEAGSQDAHETGQHHQMWLEAINDLGQCGIEVLAAGIGLVIHHGSGNATLCSPGEACGIGAIGDHRRNACAGILASTMACILEPRPEIRMTIFFMGQNVCGSHNACR